jgi:hypothetical protein
VWSKGLNADLSLRVEEMNRIAPGWNPASFLTPQHLQASPVSPAEDKPTTVPESKPQAEEEDPDAAFNSLKIT